MEILDNLKYTENHEWVLIENNLAVIGITDYAQSELGDIVYVDVDTVGQFLKIDDVFGSVEAVKTVSDLFMPISGKVIQLNAELDANPELINTEPYNNGWIVKVELDGEFDNPKLLSASEYKELIGV